MSRMGALYWCTESPKLVRQVKDWKLPVIGLVFGLLVGVLGMLPFSYLMNGSSIYVQRCSWR